jgi:RNA polymerase sigma factor (TIGR02999 family)
MSDPPPPEPVDSNLHSDIDHPITRAILSADAADRAPESLLPLMYTELRDLAHAMLANEAPGRTLQPTALVHEAYLRVTGGKNQRWDGRGHFFAAAAETMRRILIDQARRRARVRHGGNHRRVDADPDLIDAIALPIEKPSDQLLEVHELLEQLEAVDPRARQIVNLRYFTGLTNVQTAEILDLSVTTIEREWRFIRTWLRERLDLGEDL